MENTEPTYFKNPVEFNNWLKNHHDREKDLWVGFYKVKSGLESITWPESVDEALCFGWIDGIRKSIDENSYMIRFTPRKKDSIWSNVNINRFTELTKANRVQPAGIKAYEYRQENKSGIYSFEQSTVELNDDFKELFKKNKVAWNFFYSQAPWYIRTASWWVISAKREETRIKRLNQLTAESEKGQRLAQLTRGKTSSL
jgi:uncharacterized protein YdeI (YjbR/CyaY-like superfamily)